MKVPGGNTPNFLAGRSLGPPSESYKNYKAVKESMKIACPIINSAEVEPLAKSGADEFFCGVLYGDKSINFNIKPATEKFNLKNLEELEKTKKLNLAVNS